ncbi:MAG: enoyl-CoA hydratase/isomerase family protein [Pseudoxanthomonas sp.]
MSLIETQDHAHDVRELRLARAPVNALDATLCQALVVALDQAASEGARGVVLSGAPGVFSGGMDVPWLLSLGSDQTAVLAGWESFFNVVRALASAPLPVVAALTGHAPAGGCVVALCCDYRVMAASRDAAKPFTIGLNETQVGLVAPEGIQRLLRRAVGEHRAAWLLMQGELVSAEQAHAIGLVDELLDIEAVVPRSVAWLQTLLARPSAAMLQTRRIARAALVEALHPDQIQLERFVEAWTREETQQALQAMVARVRKR